MAPHMKPQELAKVFGWKTLQMAMRYYNPTAQELVDIVSRVELSRASAGARLDGLDAVPLARVA